jgi:hypothetical protein
LTRFLPVRAGEPEHGQLRLPAEHLNQPGLPHPTPAPKQHTAPALISTPSLNPLQM